MKHSPCKRWRHPALVTLLLAAVAPAVAAQTVKIDSSWLKSTAADSTAEVTLIAGLRGVNGGMEFNGATKGALVITVPVGWHVVFHFRNNDQMMPHSVEVVPTGATIPVQAVPPAFAHAESPNLLQGTPPDGHADIRFRAERAGTYWIICAVPGHAAAGMWLRFVVSATQQKASIGVAPAGTGAS